nr:probable (S)-N-methylcoclaurine 3'-hydroxylase isozyme 2 [Tanacetum cinerariifolium]
GSISLLGRNHWKFIIKEATVKRIVLEAIVSAGHILLPEPNGRVIPKFGIATNSPNVNKYLAIFWNSELFAAGIESLSFTTEWFVSELLKNQEVFEKAKDEVTKEIGRNVVKESDLVRLPFLEACFKETLRLRTLQHHFFCLIKQWKHVK